MPVVEMQSVCKEYSGRQVLKDISFKVRNGEIFILVGPSGAGKTTLLRILDLLEMPTNGKVLFDGGWTDSLKEKVQLRRKIGMIFQQTVLFNMSVSDNVEYGLKIRGKNARDNGQEVKEALDLVQLHGFEQKNALTLSGGEAQRVALAQALITEPELLLLDEPTANLDPRNISIIEEVLARVNREKKTTMIMATHNMFQAESLAQRVAVFNEGKIEKIGAFQEIFEKPSKFLTDFARLENVFSGNSTRTGDGTSLINVGEGIQLEAAFEKNGNVTVYVRPEDVILSTQPVRSSARNMFEGQVIQISVLGPLVKLKVRAGKDFTVQITKRSFNEMQLNVDSKIFLVFKASSVQSLN